MSKHTEGPWTLHTIKHSETGASENAFRGPMAGDYALVGSDDTCPGILWGDWQYAEGNACLIAAAPELLSSLKALVACINETRGKQASDALFAANAAIAKAEGK